MKPLVSPASFLSYGAVLRTAVYDKNDRGAG
jgi:hypothetical protein